MAFPGENQQLVRNVERIEGVLQQVVFQHGNADVGASGDHVGGSLDFIDLENGGFIVITLCRFPGAPAEKVGIIVGGVVVAPITHVLHGAGAGNGSFEARGLGNEPVGHVAAITIAADGEPVGIGNAVFDQSVDTLKNVFTRAGDDLGNDLHQELVAVSA